MSFQIVATDGLDKEAQELLRKESGIELIVRDATPVAELADALKNADVAIIRSATVLKEAELSKLPNLKGVLRAGVGIDNIDIKSAEALGIWVWNAPTGNFQATAELALGLVFSVARKIPYATGEGRKGKWAKKEVSGGARQLQGSTLGVFGVGNIGSRLARMAAAIGMDVVLYDPVATPADLPYKKMGWDEFLKACDFISIHAPMTPDTKKIFNKDAFAKMRKGSFIVNAARGGIIDESALADALESGHLGGAALDVFETEPFSMENPVLKRLLEHPSFVSTPHVGASTKESQRQVGLESAEKMIALFHATTGKSLAAKPLNKPAQPRLAVKTL